ncbi:MAG: putative ABC transporter permease [Oscillospiraceae bacterium]|nr:putative ABC transporter permease [Oscillospiraceae bacterium]
MKKDQLLQRYGIFCAAVILFAICGFCGWIYEIAVTSYLHGHFVNRGFLHIPILPIYGVFSFIMLPVFKKYNSLPVVFFGGMAITTVLELAASYIIEWILGYGLWSYRSWDFNFDGRISLYSSLAFGAMSVILIKGAYPLVKKMYEKLSLRTVCIFGSMIAAAIIADFVYTLNM